MFCDLSTLFSKFFKVFLRLFFKHFFYLAYEIRADSLQTVLLIDKNGIDFSDGIIYSPKEAFDFTGDVKWNGKGPHTSWEVIQRHGGVARAYVSILDSISLDVTADSVEISTTADTCDIKTTLDCSLCGNLAVNGSLCRDCAFDFFHNRHLTL